MSEPPRSVLPPVAVLVTSVGNDVFPSVLEALKDNGEREVTVVGVDVCDTAVGLHLADLAFLVPRRDDPEALIQALLDLAVRYRSQVLLPLSTDDQQFFARWAPRFATAGVTVVTSSLEALKVAQDKRALLEMCSRAELACPAFVPVSSAAEFERGARMLGWPDRSFVFKPDRGAGGKGFKLVEPRPDPAARLFDRDGVHIGYDELRGLLGAFPDLPPSHVAQYLPGAEYSVDVLCRHGTVLAAVVRQRVAIRSGLASHARVLDHPAAETTARQVVTVLGLSYVANVQLRCDEVGQPRLLEVNPLLPGTVALTVAAGLNLPYLAVKQAIGEELGELPAPKLGTELLRTWRTVIPSREIGRP